VRSRPSIRPKRPESDAPTRCRKFSTRSASVTAGGQAFAAQATGAASSATDSEQVDPPEWSTPRRCMAAFTERGAGHPAL